MDIANCRSCGNEIKKGTGNCPICGSDSYGDLALKTYIVHYKPPYLSHDSETLNLKHFAVLEQKVIASENDMEYFKKSRKETIEYVLELSEQ